MKQIFFILALFSCWLLLTQASTAQNKPTLYDSLYQYSKDVGKPITYKFPISNKGTNQLFLDAAQHPYANIEIKMPVSPLRPGKTDTLEITYWPYKVGFFRRNIVVPFRVKKNGALQTREFVIAGEITDDRTWKQRFPYTSGGLRFDKRTVYFGQSKQGNQMSANIRFVNPTGKPLPLDLRVGYSDNTMVSLPEKRMVNPGEVVLIPVYLSTSKLNKYGYHEEPFTLIDRTNASTLNFTAKALIVSGARYAPFLSPIIITESDTIQLGKVGEDEMVDVLFEIKNNGTKPLEIYRIEPVETIDIKYLVRSTIPPGESTHLMMVVHDPNFFGEQTRSFGIYSNDPRSPLKVVHVHGEYP